MKKIITAVFLMLATFSIFAVEEVRTDSEIILVAARQKLDAFSAKDGVYLGKFSDLKDENGNSLLTPHAMLKTSDNKILVAGYGSPINGEHVRMVKLNLDGTFDKIFFKQSTPNITLNKPTRIIELSDGSIMVFESSNKKIFKFNSDGSLIGEFLATDTNLETGKRNDIILFKEGGVDTVVITSSDVSKKILQYNLDETLKNDLTPISAEIKNPAYISKMSDGKYLIVDITYNPKKLMILDKDFYFEKIIVENGLMKSTFAVENELTKEIVVIDQGRVSEKSYDDNVEVFGTDGKFIKSVYTYDDGVLRNLMYINGITKKW